MATKTSETDYSAFTKLSDFGYTYNDEGKLVKISDGSGFDYVDHAHYEALGDRVLEYIEEALRVKYHLRKVRVPLENSEDPADAERPHSFIYASEDYETNTEKLMLLVQGCGAVRPGVWARSCCMNNDLSIGSMFPYIERAQSEGWSVLILNPNQSDFRLPSGELVTIPECQDQETHVEYVFRHYLPRSPAANIGVVAHSLGGYCMMRMLAHPDAAEFFSRIRCIAFTDSAHMGGHVLELTEKWRTFVQGISRNWISSEEPLDTPIPEGLTWTGVECVSAGHEKHEFTSGTAFPSVLDFLSRKIHTE